MLEQPEWVVLRSQLVDLIGEFANSEAEPEQFEKTFLSLRNKMIDKEPDDTWDRDDPEDRLVEEVLWAVDDYVPTSMGVERAPDQIDESQFVARVRAEWERYQAQREP